MLSSRCRPVTRSFVFTTSQQEKLMKQTYAGGCHCGAVRYEADVDLAQGTVKCNCSICGKARTWLAATDAKSFRLLSGVDALSEYQFGGKRIRHLFCKHCGVKSFARGTEPDGMVVVVVSCLENIPDAERAALSVMYVNGRDDDFASAPAETRHL
jgi:hypothetical protein